MAASVTWAGLALLCFALTSHAAELPPPAYQLAAHAANIPSEVLYSVALQESGTPLRGQLVPWPWTLNVAGASYRFATRAYACTALIIALAQAGPKRVDVGLGQVNMGWNGQRFKSSNPCDALNPYKNLDVAAQMLAELRRQSKASHGLVRADDARPACCKPVPCLGSLQRYRASWHHAIQPWWGSTDI